MMKQIKSFDKYQSIFLKVLSTLEQKEQPYTSVRDIFYSNPEFYFAISLQNQLHPKNSQRVQAVQNGTYTQINSTSDANDYLASLLRRNL